MKYVDHIIKDYEAADEEKRLSMFLSHRDLRAQFMAIDCAEMTVYEKTKSSPVRALKSLYDSCCFTSTCWRWLKNCWSTS